MLNYSLYFRNYSYIITIYILYNLTFPFIYGGFRMSFTELKRSEIKRYLLEKIDSDDPAFIAKTADSFGISVTSVKRYIQAECDLGNIMPSESAKSGYKLKFSRHTFRYSITDLCEYDDLIFYDDVFPHLTGNDNSKNIWNYTLAEIFNNAIEHSEGSNIQFKVDSCCLYNRITIADDGVGIFRKICDVLKTFGMKNPRPEDAVTELFIGKMTTLPDRHSGEGIFFTMHLLKKMAIVSDGIILQSGFLGDTSLIKNRLLAYAMKFTKKGTVVIMQISNETKRNVKEIFNSFSDPDEGFYRTSIPVFKACLERQPVSRSQARRIYMRLNSFKEAILDFSDVEYMGQGFADELFRVFQNTYPNVTLKPINMNEETMLMYQYTIHNKVTVPKYN